MELEYDFIDLNLLEESFFHNKALLTSINQYAICPIGNILQLTEKAKKENINWPSNTVENVLEKNYNGHYFISEVDAHCLSERMFKDNSKTGFDDLFINRDIQPRFSINLLSLKSSESTWWPDEIFQQACEEIR